MDFPRGPQAMPVNRLPLSAATVNENGQCCRAGRPLGKIHCRKIIQEKLRGEIPAKDHGHGRTEIWQEGNNRDDNCAVRTVVSSTKLTNPVTLKTRLPDRSVPWKLPP